MGSASLKKSSRRSSVRAKLLLKKNTSSGSVSDATVSGKNWSGAVSGHWSFWKKIHVEQFRAKFLQKMPQSRLLQGSGVRRLKFFTPTPLLLSVNILRLRTNSKTFVSFALRLLFKLEIEWYKPRRKCSKITPAPLRLFVKKKTTPAPLLLSKFIKTPAGVHSCTPAPVHHWFKLVSSKNLQVEQFQYVAASKNIQVELCQGSATSKKTPNGAVSGCSCF